MTSINPFKPGQLGGSMLMGGKSNNKRFSMAPGAMSMGSPLKSGISSSSSETSEDISDPGTHKTARSGGVSP